MAEELTFKTAKSGGKMGSGEASYRASIEYKGTLERGDIAQIMQDRYGIRRAQTEFHISALCDVLTEALAKGYRVGLPGLFSMAMQIGGAFAAPDEPFSARKHPLTVGFTVRKELRNALESAGIAFSNVSKAAQVRIRRALDAVNKISDVIGARNLVLLSGEGLNLAASAPGEGVWMENSKGIRIATGSVAHCTATTLECNFTFAEEVREEIRRASIVVASRAGRGSTSTVVEARRKVTIVP